MKHIIYLVLNWLRSLRFSNKKTQATRTAAKKSVVTNKIKPHLNPKPKGNFRIRMLNKYLLEFERIRTSDYERPFKGST
jgi:hypothetical protein